MDLDTHTSSSSLERYSFYVLLALLVFSAVALFLGGRPPITLITGSSSVVWQLLSLGWLLSGVSAGYLAYQWAQNKKQLFGRSDIEDTLAFVFMIAAGLNLGITGATGVNIFLDLFMGRLSYIVTGVLCIGVAGYLYKQWQKNDDALFGAAGVTPPVSQTPSQQSNAG